MSCSTEELKIQKLIIILAFDIQPPHNTLVTCPCSYMGKMIKIKPNHLVSKAIFHSLGQEASLTDEHEHLRAAPAQRASVDFLGSSQT